MNWTGKLAQIFIRNGNLSLLIVISVFIWGIFSFILTPKQYNPKITAPSFQVVINYPGASKNEVVEEVTKPLERVLANIPGIEDIYSVSYGGGRAVLNVNFYVGEDVDSAKITLDDRIRSNMHLIPMGIDNPVIVSIDPEDVPVMTVALTSSGMNPVELRKFAFRLRDRLGNVPGTSTIDVLGGRRKGLYINLDPMKLASSGVGIMDIENALSRDNLYLPSGKIRGRDRYIPLEAESLIKKPEDLENSIIISGDYGQIRLKEIARVKEEVEETNSYIRHLTKRKGLAEKTGTNSVLISIAKLNGENISDVTDAVRKKIEELKKGFIPSNVTADVIVDEGQIARNEIMGLVVNLFTAVVIVVVILFLFLNRRAALLVAVSIPLTLAVVFIVALLSGENVNRITLFALILSLGLLVDSSTVVIENIVRHLNKDGERRSRSGIVINAVNEVGPGLFMSTVTTILAFVPMAFVTGMMGPYMGPIPFFVPVALVASLLISLTINPWMAAVLLREEIHHHARKKDRIAYIKEKFDFIGNRIVDYYGNYLRQLMNDRKKLRRTMSVIAVLVLVSLSLPVLKLVKFRMLPKADREQFFLYIDMPSGTSLEKTFDASVLFEKELLKSKYVAMVQSYVGTPPVMDFNGLFRNVSSRQEHNQATIRVGLVTADKRSLKSEEIVERLRPVLEEKALNFPVSKGRVKLKLVEDPPGPPVQSTMLVKIQGENESLLRQVAEDLFPKIKKIEGIVDTDSSVEEGTETIRVRVNHARAFMSRISARRIVKSLNTAYSGAVMGVYHNDENIEQEYITIRFDRHFRQDPSILDRIYLYNDLRIRIKLKDLVTVEKIKTPYKLMRENGRNTVYFYGDMSGRSVTYAAIDIIKLLYVYRLHDGKGKLEHLSLFGADYSGSGGAGISVAIGGEWELTLEVFRDLGIAMIIAVLFIYAVLVGQFRSFGEPVLVMSTIPLGLIGIMPGFMILGVASGVYFNATSMIGFIALAGIAVNNSIIFLEYLKSFRGRGVDIVEAISDSAVTRFRPILLTSVTTILGSLTIINDPVWAGLAYSLIFGLAVSSLLTLVVFPALFFMIYEKKWD